LEDTGQSKNYQNKIDQILERVIFFSIIILDLLFANDYYQTSNNLAIPWLKAAGFVSLNFVDAAFVFFGRFSCCQCSQRLLPPQKYWRQKHCFPNGRDYDNDNKYKDSYSDN
jgi:hypothetical protein